MAHAQCVKLQMVCWWGIPHVNYSIAHQIRMCTRSFREKLASMFGTHLLFIQSETSYGSTLSAMSIDFRSLINWIAALWFSQRLIAQAAQLPELWTAQASILQWIYIGTTISKLPALLWIIGFVRKQLLAAKCNLEHDENNRSELHCTLLFLHGWRENCSWYSLCCNGDGSSADIMWILATC